MNYSLRLLFPDTLKSQSQKIHNLLVELEKCVAESEFLGYKSSFMTVSVLLNEDLSKYTNLTNVNSVLNFDFNALGEDVSGMIRRAFVLSCMRLQCKDINGLTNVLIRIEFSEPSYSRSQSTQDNEDVETEKSYVAVTPKYKLSNMILDKSTKQQLERAITLIRNQKLIFEDWGFKEIDPFTKTILCFYGSPGTGKTMCAHALATELGKKILIASYASIESKWVGEGPKNLRKIFQDAEEQDAILFFDEADSFLSKRVQNAETGSDKHYNRMSNEMFQLLENYNGIIIFATNLVADFDKAFKSRILAFIEFTLPDEETRARLIQIMTPRDLPMVKTLTLDELKELATIIDGFSGREIRKGMLTVLSDGAMRGVKSFAYEDFVRGFKAVKNDTESIEASMNGNRAMSNCVQDFIQYEEENSAIIEICLNTLWQSESISDAAKKEIIRICKGLGADIPDLQTKGYLKDISVVAEKLQGTGRESECMRYCCDLLSCNNLDEKQDQKIIFKLGEVLKVKNLASYIKYVSSLKQLVLQQ